MHGGSVSVQGGPCACVFRNPDHQIVIHGGSDSMQGGPCAFVFQNPDHQIVMPTVGSEVALGSGAQELTGNPLKEHVMLALRRMRLDHLAEGATATLSGGEKQRLVIAAALAQGPPRPQVPSLALFGPRASLEWLA
jgi:ABC-type sulfate/molybdate transport systems ATPase subunit